MRLPPSKRFLRVLSNICNTSIRYKRSSNWPLSSGFRSSGSAQINPLPPTPYRCIDLDQSYVSLLVHIFDLGVKCGSTLKLHLQEKGISYIIHSQWSTMRMNTKNEKLRPLPTDRTLTLCLLATTWALVTISPSSDTTKPEPLATATSRFEKTVLSRETGSVNVK